MVPLYRLTLPAVALFLLIATACAQDFWQPTNGPLGGAVTAFVQPSPQSLIALVENSVLFRLDTTTLRWSRIGESLPASEVLRLSRGRPGELFAWSIYTPQPFLYRSTDEGTSWTAQAPLPDSSQLYAIWLVAWPNGDLVLEMVGVTWRSTDAGEHWFVATGILPELVAGNGGDTLYGALNDPWPSHAGHVFRSTDSGHSWEELVSNQWFIEVNSLTMSPGGHLFLGAESPGLLRSANGSDWELISTDSRHWFQLAWTPDHSLFWLGDSSIIRRSTDNGNTWDVLTGSLPQQPYSAIASAGPGGNVYLGTRERGVYRSTSDGGEWLETNDGLAAATISALAPGNDGTIVALTRGTAYTSLGPDSGWRGNGLAGVGGGRIIRSEPGTLLAITSRRSIVRSVDGGERWDSVHVLGESDGALADLTIAPGGGIIALGSRSVGILSSTDDGASWRRTGGIPSNIYDRGAIASALDGGIYISGNTYGRPPSVYRSTDLGLHWDAADSGMPGSASAWTFFEDRSGHVWSAGKGIYRLDTWNTWIPASGGLTDDPVVALFGSSWGTLYAGTYRGGVFQSTDLGENWSALNSGLPNTRVTCFSEDSLGFLYAGTFGRGVFRSTRRFRQSNASPPLPDRISLEQNYPNPFNSGTTIRFSIPHSGWTALKIYDLLGKAVGVLHEGRLSAGEHHQTWDGAGRPSGVYFCRLQTDTHTVTRKMLLLR